MALSIVDACRLLSVMVYFILLQKREEGWWVVIGDPKTNRYDKHTTVLCDILFLLVLHQSRG